MKYLNKFFMLTADEIGRLISILYEYKRLMERKKLNENEAKDLELIENIRRFVYNKLKFESTQSRKETKKWTTT